MNTNVLTGKLVRLAVPDPEKVGPVSSRWGRDSQFLRLAGGGPARPFSAEQIKSWTEEDLKSPNAYPFSIYTLEEDRLIGDIGLDGIDRIAGNAWVGIGIGERDYWGKGYGTDAMRVILSYGFCQLNLHRVSLTVFEYNPRAIRCYEKAGFREEGRTHQWMKRAGRRWDVVYMGILRSEWEATQAAP